MNELKKPDAILCADIHLMESNPVCRLDDFINETQWQKIQWLSDLQKKNGCPVIHSGDLFDYWKPSPELLSKAFENLPNRFYTVYGNHDLPQHNIDLDKKSGIYTLMKGGKIDIINGGHWLDIPNTHNYTIGKRKLLVWHVMTYQGKKPWDDCTAPKSAKLLRQYPDIDLILTGDNHLSFIESYEGRLLVNPGSLFRSKASQIDFQPSVLFYYADTNTVEKIPVPIASGVISREHLEVKVERENRIDAFVTSLNEEWVAELSFENNLEKFSQLNNIDKKVMDIVYKAIE